MHASKVSAMLYAKMLYNKALRYGIVIEEERVESLFAEGLDKSMSENMRVHLKPR